MIIDKVLINIVLFLNKHSSIINNLCASLNDTERALTPLEKRSTTIIGACASQCVSSSENRAPICEGQSGAARDLPTKAPPNGPEPETISRYCRPGSDLSIQLRFPMMKRCVQV